MFDGTIYCIAQKRSFIATEATKTTTAVAPTTSVMVARCDATGAEEGEATAPPPRLSAADEPVTHAIKGEWLEATLLFGS